MKYELIKSENLQEFNNTINSFLNDGWEIWGETKCIIQEKFRENGYSAPYKVGENMFYIQTMIKVK